MKNKSSRRRLQIQSKKQNPKSKEKKTVGAITSTSSTPFKLPDVWVVERRPRRTNCRCDKYYYEPSIGRQFRSLSSIQKYLSEKIDVAPKRLKPGNETNMQIVPCIFRSSTFNLPKGWIVEKKSHSNVNYTGVIDRCYIEPGTGKQFRSLISVERYLTEGKIYEATPKALTNGKEYLTTHKALKLGEHTVKTSLVDLHNPPVRIKWVLGPRGNAWSPLIDDTRILESVKHKWFETFVWTLNYG
ncbi:methyl-CpG-binding domain-containing protein 7 isoform X1 [Ricinus communis]|uniref:methyl-CpG-binding domain-containing protein 7 isoform X1 n=1 Tax=Ricinus communis TaxID=3988 RepID=UPI00201AD0FA|nr:methyl-CpG-binding domain-containing protein 7 isoform X1 [Ricinus communis]